LVNMGHDYTYDPTTNTEWRGQMTATINGVSNCTICYDLEDSNDASNNYKVGPLGGGQNYDAEALVATVVGSNLYIGIATGQRPDNGFSYFAPGDICITTNSGVFGIEVGGGAGFSGTANGEITGGQAGTSYNLSAKGYTNSTSTPSNQLAGSIWKGGTWFDGIAGSGGVPTQLVSGGTKVGQLAANDYVYNFDSAFGQHAFIELCIPNYTTLFNDSDGATIRWAPVCGNDQLSLCVVLPGPGAPGASVPEPASVMIWAVLLLTAACFARKKLSPFGRL